MPAFVFDALERRLKKWRTIDLRLKRDRRTNDTQTFEINYVVDDTSTDLLFSALAQARFPAVDEAAKRILERCGIAFDADEFPLPTNTTPLDANVDPQLMLQFGCCG
jgi:hypothetical protein